MLECAARPLPAHVPKQVAVSTALCRVLRRQARARRLALPPRHVPLPRLRKVLSRMRATR